MTMTMTTNNLIKMNGKKADSRKRNNQSSRATMSGGGGGGKPTAVSAAAMGRGLVVLLATATSCAAFSSSGSAGPSLTSTTSTTSTSIIGLSSSIANRQSQCRLPMSLSSSMSSPDDNMYDEHQAAMDEYLDYVGRRYNRLRSPPSKTSAVATILGLTRLASARLRFRQSVLQMPYSALSSSSSSSGIANSLSTIQSTSTSAASLFLARPKKLIKLNTLNRVVANFFSLRIIPELIHKAGFSVAGLLAFLLIAGPLLLTGTQA